MSNGTVAIPLPKTFYGLDSKLFDGLYNVWFFTSSDGPVIKSPIEIPLLPRKVTILSSISDVGRWGVLIRVEPKPDGGVDQSGVAVNLVITGLIVTGILFAGVFTFDKIEAVIDENKFTFGLFGIAAAAFALYLLIRAWKK